MPVTTPILVEQFLFGVKTEASYGAFATLAVTDYLYVSKCDVKVDSKEIERNYKKGGLYALDSAPGDTLVTISVEGEYVVSGAAGKSIAPMSALEEAAGLFMSASSTTVTFLLQHTASTNFPSPGKSATMQAYYRGELVNLRGVYGNMVETHQSDGIVRWKFDGKGLYVGVTASAAVPAPTFPNTYVKVASASMSVHGYDPEWSKFEVNYGTQVEAIPYAGDTYGYSRVMIVDRKPEFTFDPLHPGATAHDFIGKMVSKVTGSATYVVGTGTGKIITYSFPTTQYKSVDIADRNGLQAFNVTGKVIGGAWTKVIS